VTGSFIGKCHPTDGIERVPINIDPAVRKRLRDLLEDFPEFHAVGYSAFINRAIELAEGEAMVARRECKHSCADVAATLCPSCGADLSRP